MLTAVLEGHELTGHMLQCLTAKPRVWGAEEQALLLKVCCFQGHQLSTPLNAHFQDSPALNLAAPSS